MILIQNAVPKLSFYIYHYKTRTMPFPSSIKFGVTARRCLSYTLGPTHQSPLTKHMPATQHTSIQLK